jgi:hypothetical protein
MTYVLTGESAPTDLEKAVQVLNTEDNIPISAGEPIDIYLYCTGEDGIVRVDV